MPCSRSAWPARWWACWWASSSTSWASLAFPTVRAGTTAPCGRPEMDERSFDVIVVGTGFASSFFLKRYLEHAPSAARVLVLERGGQDTKPWQLENRRTSSLAPKEVFRNLT